MTAFAFHRGGAEAEALAAALHHGRRRALLRRPRLAALQRHAVLALQPADQLHTLGLGQPPSHGERVGALALPRQQVDVRRAAARADRELRLSRPVVGRLQHVPFPAEDLGQRQPTVDWRLRVIGEQDQRVGVEELVEAAGRFDQLREAVVRLGDRLDACLRPVAVGVVVVVGQGEEQEVVAVVRAPTPPRSRPSSRRGCRGSRSPCRAPRGWRRAPRRRAPPAPRCDGGT